MTPAEAKAWAAQLAQRLNPGPKGEPPQYTQAQAVGLAALLGAFIAASDPVSGALDNATTVKLQAGLTAANLSRDPDAAAFSQSVLKIDPTVDIATALQAGAQHVADAKGIAIDLALQQTLSDVASAVVVVPTDVSPAKADAVAKV